MQDNVLSPFTQKTKAQVHRGKDRFFMGSSSMFRLGSQNWVGLCARLAAIGGKWGKKKKKKKDRNE